MKSQKPGPPYNVVVHYKNGDRQDSTVASYELLDELCQRCDELGSVSHVWVEGLDGPGYDWDGLAKLWQRRLF